MNLLKRNSIWFVLILTSLAVAMININTAPTTNTASPVFKIPKNFQGVKVIDEWLAIGPFLFDTVLQAPEITLNNLDLAIFKIDERHVNDEDIQRLSQTAWAPFLIKGHNSPLNLMDHTSADLVSNKSNFYLYTTIYSETERELVLISDGSRNYRIWLNKMEILKVTGKENTVKNGDRFIRVKISKGINNVCVKVNRGINKYSWTFLLAIASIEEAKKIYKANYLSDFLNDPAITDSLSIYLGPHRYGKLSISDIQNPHRKFITEIRSSDNQNATVFPKKLPIGLYRCELILGKDTLQEMLYKGNFLQYINTVKNRSEKFSGCQDARNDIRSGVERLDFLLQKLDLTSDAGRKYYHRNLLVSATALEEMLNYIEKHHSSNFISGTYLKTSNSGNSGINQFLIHTIQSPTKGNKIPLILVVPYNLTDSSMARGWYIGNLDQIDMDKKLADKYGFAICWLFVKGKDDSRVIAGHIKAVLSRIVKDYNINTNQVYLLGDCAGGSRALSIAENNPKLYGGLALYSPDLMEIGKDPLLSKRLKHLKNVPFFVRHGDSDQITPIKNTENFVNFALAEGLSIKFDRVNTGHFNISREERCYAFEFFSKLNRNSK